MTPHRTPSVPETAPGAGEASPALELRRLRRDYAVRTAAPGTRRRRRQLVRAVDEISLRVDRGEAVGFVGANGAGKSTTIKMITGILQPTAGSLRVLGRVPVPERRRLAREIGVVFGQRSQLWWDLPLRDSYRILGAMHRLTDRALAARLDRLVDGLDLGGFLDRPVRQLSLGQRMRGEVAAALLHSPALVVLDEPTIGLDMVSKEGLRRFLREDRAERGTTLFLTTHDMGDVERLCARIVVVDSGQVAFDGALTGFRERLGAPRELVLDLAAPRTAPLVLPEGARALPIEADGIRHRIAFSGAELTAPALLTAVSAQVEVQDLALTEPSVEDLVRRLHAGRRPGRM
ncbi:ABC transporter ATP-binding protein [Brachybacterium saurashtrense]|uniref:ATP-binding cassette domain-containing protein n=1 Tax=Brachybacterium saurashtrense TaxID=556288 RepID=A0A345YKT2_9MICO|nr:ATP-binding cassette domain-containing protein [Brachybacterium saurashtrense]AXK44534.1 ATP-binding cassette domain-containing protein [Brachybacterium saurashtrense]RRR23146.1 ATP-binding cassette domain-containing protein [Brachybacterium saurashtrense]